MRVVTFYSFKGGVGRTLSLVNVGVELARTGRRVLLVDFDLEAPGIDTFSALKPPRSCPGVVEYVSSYIATASASDVRDYVYKAKAIGGDGGELWIMPAGKGTRAYASKLRGIDWCRLYAQQHGYLMFEDLKAQWKESLALDYVLVDSRTGHTEIEGICTRHLPDAVVVLFFPNRQNLNGLKDVVSNIKAEALQPRDKKIALHYVMSNVPDLDDEDEILLKWTQLFQKQLGYDRLGSVIHRYDSLDLLNQEVFVLKHPKSRLSSEYRELMNALVEENPEDRQGVISFLENTLRRQALPNVTVSEEGLKDKLDKIAKLHSDKGEVLTRLVMLYESMGSSDAATSLLERALQAGSRSPFLLLLRAERRRAAGEIEGACEDAIEALGSEEARLYEVRRAVELLRKANESLLSLVAKSPSIRRLDYNGIRWVVDELMYSRKGLPAAVALLRGVCDDSTVSDVSKADAKLLMVLCLIGMARHEEAKDLITLGRPNPSNLSIEYAFNYAMAEWAQSRQPPRDMLERVIELDRADSSAQGSGCNYNQCLALALFLCDRTPEAYERIKIAEEEAGQFSSLVFSCWRYLNTPLSVFIEDCQSLRKMFAGDAITPLFFEP